MKSSEILREAARRLEDGRSFHGACEAICRAALGARYSNLALACDLDCWKYFAPLEPGESFGLYWWSRNDHGPRIIGLCLAAAIAESEGD